MVAASEREDGWEGDLIALLLITVKDKERQVWIRTDLGDKYKLPLAQLKVIHASDEFSMPLFDPELKAILIGSETEMRVVNGRDRRLMEKVALIAFATLA